jgi:xylulose-5-phosphate/fructose-6-phosphate phosphoketolase
MSANPHANGGALKRPLQLPDFKLYAVPVVTPGQVDAEATRIMGNFLRDVMQENMSSRNFRIFGPDETASNRLQAVFEATDRAWDAETIPDDDHLARRKGHGDPQRTHMRRLA